MCVAPYDMKDVALLVLKPLQISRLVKWSKQYRLCQPKPFSFIKPQLSEDHWVSCGKQSGYECRGGLPRGSCAPDSEHLEELQACRRFMC